MAGNLTDAGETLALNLLFRNAATPPTDIYLGLATAAVGDADDLSTITEEDDGAYSRQAVTFTTPADNGSGATETTNDAAIEFGPWGADADNAITYAFLTDAQTGNTTSDGDILAWFELPQSKTLASGETLTVPLNELVFDID